MGSKPTNGAASETAPAHARRFGRAREARAASLLEDYTELIADLTPPTAKRA